MMEKPVYSNAFIARIAAVAMLLGTCTGASAFPNAHEDPPGWWPASAPRFALSASYPATRPPAESLPWKSIDFRTAGLEYLRAVLAYVYEGNLQVDWRVNENAVRKWYHVPWMEVGKYGREFVHGLTRERTSNEGELWNSPPNPTVQNWAVGFYNPPGGYVLGQFWKNPLAPDPGAAKDFPDGTVAAKLLFTSANARDVPYLRGAPEWQANIHKSVECRIRGVDDSSPLCEREIQTVRLLQIDIAVRDDRPGNPSPTNWVFGTFVYDADAPGVNAWNRMVPVGIMWGNDPGVTPDMVQKGFQLRETVINRGKIPPQRLGCAGRLNGPVDHPTSSCLSCHATASYPSTGYMAPRACDGSPDSLSFFNNINTATPRDPNVAWMDYSLQLASAFRNFCVANPAYGRCRTPSVAANPVSALNDLRANAPVFSQENARLPAVTRGD
jgi:hypothetical protein